MGASWTRQGRVMGVMGASWTRRVASWRGMDASWARHGRHGRVMGASWRGMERVVARHGRADGAHGGVPVAPDFLHVADSRAHGRSWTLLGAHRRT